MSPEEILQQLEDRYQKLDEYLNSKERSVLDFHRIRIEAGIDSMRRMVWWTENVPVGEYDSNRRHYDEDCTALYILQTMYNEEQDEYMRTLAAIPLEEKCWCGWFRYGQCPNCRCVETCADKVLTACPECGNTKGHPDRPLFHRKGCSRQPISVVFEKTT